MTKFCKKTDIVMAVQWFKDGDRGVMMMLNYRWDNINNDEICKDCNQKLGVHGWLDLIVDGNSVCPGDWIITDVNGYTYSEKPKIFEANYERIDDEFRTVIVQPSGMGGA